MLRLAIKSLLASYLTNEKRLTAASEESPPFKEEIL